MSGCSECGEPVRGYDLCQTHRLSKRYEGSDENVCTGCGRGYTGDGLCTDCGERASHGGGD